MIIFTACAMAEANKSIIRKFSSVKSDWLTFHYLQDNFLFLPDQTPSSIC